MSIVRGHWIPGSIRYSLRSKKFLAANSSVVVSYWLAVGDVGVSSAAALE